MNLFQKALSRYGLCKAEEISYSQIAQGSRPVSAEPRMIRIDSPGRTWEIYKLFLCHGHEAAQTEGSPFVAAQHLPEPPKGLILHPRQWYLGFCAVLKMINTIFTDCYSLSNTNDIALFFDKSSCHAKLSKHKIPVPPALPAVNSFEELEYWMKKHNWARVFIKLNHGYSAMGIVALEKSKNSLQARTTVEMVHSKAGCQLFNTRKLRRYKKKEEIACLIDELCRQGVIVERWIPKAGIDNRIVDLRVLIIKGEPAHMALRCSKSPITNLHLLNQRDNEHKLKQRMGEEGWNELLKTCRSVAKLFPGSYQLAVDVAITSGFDQHYILEINAFGDLLNGITCKGLNTYEYQIASLLGRKRRGNNG